MDIDFTDCSIKTPEFTLNGIKTFGRLVDIIDGDSLSIVIPLKTLSLDGKLNFYKYNVRLSGIDTCEIHSKNEKCKNLAIMARDTLLNFVTCSDFKNSSRSDIHKILEEQVIVVFVECLEFDKYGRLLANVFYKDADGVNLSEYLLKCNLAYKYKGLTKLNEDEQLKLLLG